MHNKAIEVLLKKLLSKERFLHSLRVEKEVIKLADFYGISKEDAAIAGLLHDCGRYVDSDNLIAEAQKFGIRINSIERFQPKLVHAKLSAKVAYFRFGVKNKKILLAIERHTLGAPNMNLLEKIVYLADHIETTRDYVGVDKVRKLAFKDIDSAVVESISSMIRDLLIKKLPICEQTIKTRNYFLMRKWQKKK